MPRKFVLALHICLHLNYHSDYTFSTTEGPRAIGQCFSPLSQGQELTYYLLQHPSVTSSSWLYTSTNITATATSAWGIQVNGWVFADAQTTVSPTAIVTTSVGTTLISPNSTSSTSQTASPSHLSSGAIAGIAIGAILVITTAVVAAGCFFVRHRRQKNTSAPLVPPKRGTFYHEVATSDMPVHELPAGLTMHELESRPYDYKSDMGHNSTHVSELANE